ncbi:hypothetical protein [Mucilaginibacter sp. OK283]|jgi:hypothetical protein|uniref:hypothetical protein n=1 Tax=Mucilaginibacter sp. OK283 TaxID=1881049 RepID=UPI0008B5D91D|nr:hypothetical protein [Mucilaginibacter sp. OK283]SEO13650.1 hypothetical protein SAMN05428947_101439 [Mucilaginibacter sp. OK283]
MPDKKYWGINVPGIITALVAAVLLSLTQPDWTEHFVAAGSVAAVTAILLIL